MSDEQSLSVVQGQAVVSCVYRVVDADGNEVQAVPFEQINGGQALIVPATTTGLQRAAEIIAEGRKRLAEQIAAGAS